MTVPLWAWAGTLAIFAVLIAADLLVTRGTGSTGLRGAAVLSGLWIAAGLAFGGALWLWQGSDIAGQYFGGYLLEKALGHVAWRPGPSGYAGAVVLARAADALGNVRLARR